MGYALQLLAAYGIGSICRVVYSVIVCFASAMTMELLTFTRFLVPTIVLFSPQRAAPLYGT